MEALRNLTCRYLPRSRSAQTRVGRVLVIVLISAALQVIMQMLLARNLTKSEVGLFSLLLGALPILSTISMLGQDASIVRFLTRSGEATYDVRAHVGRVLRIVLPLGLAAGLLGAWFYGLGVGLALTLTALVLSQNTVTVLSSVLRAAHRYELAMFGVRLPTIAAPLVLLTLRLNDSMNYQTTALALALAYLASTIAVGLRSSRAIERGAEKIPRSVMSDGLFFFGLGVSFSFMIAIDKLIIGKMMTFEDLALYASVFAIMRGFDFLFYSMNFVLMPRVNAVTNLRLKRLNLSIAGLAVVVAAVYLVFGDRILNVLYRGLYNDGTYLILPFVLSGIAKLFYSVPSSVIGGRFPRRALVQFMWFNLAGMGVNLVLDIVLIRSMGLAGAAVATAIAWGIRLAGGYALMALNRS
ncbi:MAG: oligosaccharide flippase family protein, partial [Candidatus Eisenbacteria bacterium]|nr:oligosaccharide flippase family protein [Candidatus Eisenbacteria bacterium]